MAHDFIHEPDHLREGLSCQILGISSITHEQNRTLQKLRTIGGAHNNIEFKIVRSGKSVLEINRSSRNASGPVTPGNENRPDCVDSYINSSPAKGFLNFRREARMEKIKYGTEIRNNF